MEINPWKQAGELGSGAIASGETSALGDMVMRALLAVLFVSKDGKAPYSQ